VIYKEHIKEVSGGKPSYWDYFHQHQIITRWSSVDLSYAKRHGEELFFKGKLVGYYLKGGYDVIRLGFPKLKDNVVIKPNVKYRIVYIITYLNIEKDFDVIVRACMAYLSYVMNLSDLTLIQEKVAEMVEFCLDTMNEVKLKEGRKIFWVEGSSSLSLKDKRKVVMALNNFNAKKDLLKKITDAMYSVIEEGVEFVSPNSVQAKINSHTKDTVRTYMRVYKDEVDQHNLELFGTDDYNEYLKFSSLDKIRKAVNEVDNPTKAKVARETGLHYNTVCKLWNQI
jgi:hypothetical protein